MDHASIDALKAALAEIDTHVAEGGWDQPPRLFSLVRTAELVAAEPALAEALGLEANDPSTLTPVEQEEFPLPSLALDESLARVSWTDDVSGAAIAVERLLLPPSAERDLDTDDPEQLQRLAAGHPARREVRIAVAVLRTGQRTSLIRLRAPAVAPTAEGDTATDPTSDGDEIVTGDDLAPGLAEALLATFS